MRNKLAVRLVNEYTIAKQKLQEYKTKTFPVGTKVIVNCLRYRGKGVVNTTIGLPEFVSVVITNGNDWNYPIECVEVAK